MTYHNIYLAHRRRVSKVKTRKEARSEHTQRKGPHKVAAFERCYRGCDKVDRTKKRVVLRRTQMHRSTDINADHRTHMSHS